jgi:TfoX/Sxy family transcriptional regulator of competence genes
MDMHYNNDSKMIRKVLGLATSLGKIEYRIGKNLVGLYKNQIMFGKIEHDKVYLLNSQNKFDKIDIELLEQEDIFTKQAQKAYSLIE